MKRTLVLLTTMLCVAFAFAAGPISWKFSSIVSADGNIVVSLQAVCEEGWHIYALTLPRDDGPFPTVVRVTSTKLYDGSGAVQEPQPVEMDDPNFQMQVRYHTGSPVFTIPVKRLSAGAFDVTGEVEFMSCNDKTCLPPEVVKFTLPIAALK